MVFSKIALAVPPILVGSIALATKSPNPDSGIAIAATGVAITVTVATALILQETSGRVIDGLVLAASQRAPAFMQTGVQALLSAIRELRTLKASGYVVVVGLSVFVFGLSILGIFFAAQAGFVAGSSRQIGPFREPGEHVTRQQQRKKSRLEFCEQHAPEANLKTNCPQKKTK